MEEAENQPALVALSPVTIKMVSNNFAYPLAYLNYFSGEKKSRLNPTKSLRPMTKLYAIVLSTMVDCLEGFKRFKISSEAGLLLLLILIEMNPMNIHPSFSTRLPVRSSQTNTTLYAFPLCDTFSFYVF